MNFESGYFSWISACVRPMKLGRSTSILWLNIPLPSYLKMRNTRIAAPMRNAAAIPARMGSASRFLVFVPPRAAGRAPVRGRCWPPDCFVAVLFTTLSMYRVGAASVRYWYSNFTLGLRLNSSMSASMA